MTGCRLCNLKNQNMRPQIELLEMMLRDKGHTDWNLSKPLSFRQISYIAYIVFGIEIERHALARHFYICMGQSHLKSQVYYNSHLRVWINTKGQIIPKEELKNYKRNRSHGTLNQDVPIPSDVKQTL